MPLDPVALVFIEGVVAGAMAPALADLYDAGKRWIRRAHGEEMPEALAEADRRAALFLADLAAELLRLNATSSPPSNGELLDRADPSQTAAVREGVLSAVLTDNPDRRSLLAKLVASRLRSTPESTKAIATAQAAQLLDRLAAIHLDVLGVLALLYSIRPLESELPEVTLPPQPEGADPEAVNSTRTATSYASWFADMLAKHHCPSQTTEFDIAQLVSSGCVLRDEHAKRSLERTLVSASAPSSVRQTIPAYHAINYALRSDEGKKLHNLWRSHLSRVTLTPAGLIIGLHVHDAKTGESRALAWEWGPQHDLYDDAPTAASDEREQVYKEFRKKLERDLEREIRAGGGSRVFP